MIQTRELTLTPKQDRFVFSDSPFVAFVGGVGSGKTHAGAVKAVIRASSVCCNGMIAAPTYRMLRDSTLPKFREQAEGLIADENKTDGIITLINGSKAYCKTTDVPDHLRGLNLNWIWPDETSYMSSYVLPVCQGRLRQSFPGYKPVMFITCTPKGRNWIYDTWIRKNSDNPDYEMIQASSTENPFLPKEFLASLQNNYSGKYLAQEVHGKFVSFEGLVYDMFADDLHIMTPTEQPEYDRYEYGLDYGYTNPTAIVVYGIPKVESNIRPYDVQIDEVYERRMTQDAVVDRMLRLYRDYGIGRVWVDPSEPDLIAVLQKNGIKAYAADNDVTTGIQREQASLETIKGYPGTYILSTCIHTIAEISSYCWKTKGKGSEMIYMDKPEKSNDHCLIAGMMVETERGEVAIEQVTTEDKVLTRQGYRKVLWSGETNPDAEVFTLELSNDKTLTGTAGHPIWIQGKGWIPLDTTRYGSIIEPCEKLNRLHSKGLSSDDTLRHPEDRIGFTSYPTGNIERKVLEGSMRKSGKPSMERFRKVITCITLTAILLTTLLTILKRFRLRSIYRSTCGVPSIIIQKNIEDILRRLGRRLLNGIALLKAENGIRSMDVKCMLNENSELVFVSTAARSIKRKGMYQGSVLATVEVHGDGNQELTLRPESASCAGSSTASIAIRRTKPVLQNAVHVLSVKPSGRAPVYNLHVEGVHEFYANGVLVHNCMDARRYYRMSTVTGRNKALPSMLVG